MDEVKRRACGECDRWRIGAERKKDEPVALEGGNVWTELCEDPERRDDNFGWCKEGAKMWRGDVVAEARIVNALGMTVDGKALLQGESQSQL